MTAQPQIERLTPVLFCDAIEPSLGFWVDQLGFERTVSVPASEASPDTLGFAILERGPVQVMLQTYDSLAADFPALLEHARGQASFLFVEVADLDAAAERIDASAIFMPRRETFYGATEIGVRSPGGHYVTLAQFDRA